MNDHNCIKCGVQYKDKELDDYYCSPCLVEKKTIAKQVDAKFTNRSKKEFKKTGIDSFPKIKANVPGGFMIDSRHVL